MTFEKYLLKGFSVAFWSDIKLFSEDFTEIACLGEA